MNTKHSIEQTVGPKIQFEGQILETVSSERDDSHRWTELFVYKTVTGKFIAVSVGRSSLPHDTTYVSAEVYDKLDQIIDFFRPSMLTQSLLSKLGIENVQKV